MGAQLRRTVGVSDSPDSPKKKSTLHVGRFFDPGQGSDRTWHPSVLCAEWVIQHHPGRSWRTMNKFGIRCIAVSRDALPVEGAFSC